LLIIFELFVKVSLIYNALAQVASLTEELAFLFLAHRKLYILF